MLCQSILKNNYQAYGKVRAELGFLQASCFYKNQ